MGALYRPQAWYTSLTPVQYSCSCMSKRAQHGHDLHPVQPFLSGIVEQQWRLSINKMSPKPQSRCNLLRWPKAMRVLCCNVMMYGKEATMLWYSLASVSADQRRSGVKVHLCFRMQPLAQREPWGCICTKSGAAVKMRLFTFIFNEAAVIFLLYLGFPKKQKEVETSSTFWPPLSLNHRTTLNHVFLLC